MASWLILRDTSNLAVTVFGEIRADYLQPL